MTRRKLEMQKVNKSMELVLAMFRILDIKGTLSFWNHFSQQKFYKHLIEYSSITNATETLMEISDVTPYLDPNNGCQSEDTCFGINFLTGGLYGKWLRLWLDRGAHQAQQLLRGRATGLARPHQK